MYVPINFDKKWVWLHFGRFVSQTRLVTLTTTAQGGRVLEVK
jgi:hypothetical protein